MLSKRKISGAVEELLFKAETDLPVDVEAALRRAYRVECGVAKKQLKAILDNVSLARKEGKPICQDTGLPVFFVGVGSRADVDLSVLEEGIIEGVRGASERIPLRPNVVHPLSRVNTGNNVGVGVPVIEFEVLRGKEYVELSVLPKGAGSENMSAFRMLNPSDGVSGLKEFVLETVAKAGGNPCPPVVVGVGVGGTMDRAALLSKKALLRRLGVSSRDKVFARLERELLSDINRLGVGVMGLGGRVSCLGVSIEYSFCHTASLPVAVNVQCWANRRASVRLKSPK